MTPDQFDYIKSEFSDLKSDIASVKKFVDGGSDPERGLNTRVVMLERDAAKAGETARNAKGVAWGAATAAASAALLWAWSRITGSHHS